ncbi:hypothetical protein BDB00DRAFT_768280, partial [Zychaea mexicana]|uniref:uncharacterized protein n=1 Tax=Zychaea mexicana TaxID=64656 RepID=UPI0022FE88B5
RWHDSTSPQALTYLGYPLYNNPHQLASFLDNLYTKLEHHIALLKQRHLSIQGKSIIANSLLLSRLWHVLRVCIVPVEWLQKCQNLIRQYLLPFFPFSRRIRNYGDFPLNTW